MRFQWDVQRATSHRSIADCKQRADAREYDAMVSEIFVRDCRHVATSLISRKLRVVPINIISGQLLLLNRVSESDWPHGFQFSNGGPVLLSFQRDSLYTLSRAYCSLGPPTPLECGCLRPAAISITVLDKRCLRRAACEGVAIVRATESRPREGLLVRTTMRRGSGASSAADGARPVGEWTRRRRQRCLPLSARGLGS